MGKVRARTDSQTGQNEMASVVWCSRVQDQGQCSGVGASAHLNDLVNSTTSLQTLSILMCRGTLLLHSDGSHYLALLCPVGICDKLVTITCKKEDGRDSRG